MAYNQYGGGNPYGAPPAYGYGNPPPAMGAPPGLAPPPGMSSAPGMAPPPGVQQSNAPQANRPSGLPHNFQAPPNMPNINFNAPVIRLGTSTPVGGGRNEGGPPQHHRERPGLGMERGGDQGRAAARETVQMLIPPTAEEKLRTIFIHQIPDGVGGDEGMEKLLGAVGGLRRWDAMPSVLDSHKGVKFGFATFDNPESLHIAVKLLFEEGIEVPKARQTGTSEPPEDDSYEGIEMSKLQVTVDPWSIKYLESLEESRAEDPSHDQRLEGARAALKQAVRSLFYPPVTNRTDTDGDVTMGENQGGENVEVVNIALAQDDELADIPAEMREVVAAEIAAFRERSNQRDLERLKKEEEMEEMERRRNGPSRPSRLESPPSTTNNIPLGPRGSVANAPSGPKGQNGAGRGPAFVNGGVVNAEYSINREDEDTDASDEEVYNRKLAKQKAEEDKMYLEAERKWVNRERSRQAALEREQDREKHDVETAVRRRIEQLEREKAWDDEREANRKSHPYHRDHAGWVRKRAMDKADEEARDESDRRSEQQERRREQADIERAKGMADSFLDQQEREMEQRQTDTAAAPQPFKLSFGAAAQKAQASRAGPQRRTIAEVEGLLDDEEADSSTKRQLIPIQFDPASATAGMSEEEISQAVRALAQEIPTEKEGLWNWDVKWEFMDNGVVREKLRPFVEKKIVEYLGVNEEMLVEAVEEHLRNHGQAAALVEELEGALDDEAEDLVKKLWRMVIFFTECEKRGLPAIIAIHGLETESPHTWIYEYGGSKVNWLSDSNMLPAVVPNARIYTYDWNAKVFHNASVHSLLDHADNLLGLVAAHRYDTPDRPLVFAIHRAAQKGSPYAHILEATVGIVFLATPFAGTDAATPASWLVTIKGIVGAEASDKLIQDLESRHEFLQQRVQQFTEVANANSVRLPIWCFFETETTNIARMVLPSGLVRFLGSSLILVNRSSACLNGFPRRALNARHSTMNKFAGPDDINFQQVSHSIRTLVEDAGVVLQRKKSAESPTHHRPGLGSGLPPTPPPVKPLFVVPFGRNDLFVGRANVLDQLMEIVPPNVVKDDCQRVAIHGLGGIGKTQVANEIAYRVRDAFPNCSIFWVPAVSASLFENAYRSIGKELNIKGVDENDVKVLVKEALSQESAGHWLLIIDNADDVDCLFKDANLLSYLPFSRKGSILFTTRDNKVAVKLHSRAKILKLDALDNYEATQLLHQGLQDSQVDNSQSTTDLVKHLANHPLALRQASAYMRSNSHVTISGYLGKCKSSDSNTIRLLSQSFDDQDQYEALRKPVATTWLVSFDQITRDVPLAGDIMRFMSFLAEKDIPHSLLVAEEDPLDAEEAIGTLLSYSFIVQRDSMEAFDMHRLVRLVMHSWLHEQGLKDEAATVSMLKLLLFIPKAIDGRVRNFRSCMVHAEAALKTADGNGDRMAFALLLFYLGYLYIYFRRHDKAEEVSRRSLQIMEQCVGSRHPGTLFTRLGLAGVLVLQGSEEEAVQVQRQTLILLEEEFGSNHPMTIHAWNLFAIWSLGKLETEEKEEMYRRAQAQQKRAATTSEKAFASLVLVKVLKIQGKSKEAEQECMQALEATKKELGSEHAATVYLMEAAAMVLEEQQRYEEAEEMYRHMLRTVEGTRSPRYFEWSGRLACCVLMQNKLEEGEQLIRRSIEGREEQLSPTHPQTLLEKISLVGLLSQKGQYRAAEAMAFTSILRMLRASASVMIQAQAEPMLKSTQIIFVVTLDSYKYSGDECYFLRLATAGIPYTRTMSEFSALALLDKVDTWPDIQHDPEAYKKHMSNFFYFFINGFKEPLGYAHSDFVENMAWPMESLSSSRESRFLTLLAGPEGTPTQRTELLQKTLRQNLYRGNVLRKCYGESLLVYSRSRQHALDIDRCAVDLFGVDRKPQYTYWVPRRSYTKSTFPGLLDNFAAGNIRSGESPLEAMRREVEEETGIPDTFTRNHMRPCGTVAYQISGHKDGRPGFQYYCQYVFELELPRARCLGLMTEKSRDFK
ncbi:U1 snRNP-associated protein [Paramyrothecium foliicola]|nr:U1 snRNP-associated protein [Paramyrothecium foliicola]